MMPFEKILSVAVLALVSCPVWADTDIERDGMIAVGACFKLSEELVDDCVIKTFQEQDAFLNEMYDEALLITRREGENGGIYNERLRAAQRNWIVFRDSACLAEAGPPAESGSINYEHFFCLNRQTLRRTDDLRRIVSVY